MLEQRNKLWTSKINEFITLLDHFIEISAHKKIDVKEEVILEALNGNS